MCVDNLDQIFKAFKKGFKIAERYWTYSSLYLSSAKQSPSESVATLATRVKELVAQCEWPEREREGRHIDLYYHITEHFDVKQYIQNETVRESANLTWEKLVDKVNHQERVGKEYAKFRRENSGGGTPSYGNPALSAHTISRGYRKPQLRSQTLSGGKGGNSQQQCQRCGKCNSCKKAKPMTPASMDISPETTHSKPQPSATERTETDSSQEQNLVLLGDKRYMQNSVLSAKEGEKTVLKGEQIALKYHKGSTTGQWLMPRLTT